MCVLEAGFEPCSADDGPLQLSGGDTVLIEGRIVDAILDADVSDRSCGHHWHLKKG